MTATSGESATIREEAAVAAPNVPAPLSGNPALLGLPVFIVGSLALGMVLVGVVPAAAVGASLPIILSSTAIGLLLATIWAAAVGQSAVASVFGIFAGFWLSYAVLVLGLVHNWFGIGTVINAVSVQELFLVSWLVLVVLLTLATVRLPLAFTVLFVLVDVALLLVLLGTTQASTGLLKAGGYAVFAFAAVGVYLFYDATVQATGGPALPLGKPLMHS
ncbi:MAG TPA: GPR1/FUN34/YaaH family transporter [Streptosporangiaceae bacterium]|nr:GPR1/FUN34/YaaH family transporter [Streptosporangiaceae bacterium]